MGSNFRNGSWISCNLLLACEYTALDDVLSEKIALAYLSNMSYTNSGLGESSLGHRRREEFPAIFLIYRGMLKNERVEYFR